VGIFSHDDGNSWEAWELRKAAEEIRTLKARLAAAEKLAEALEAVTEDRRYQKLYGAPYFTSAPTEHEWKADSAKKAWGLAAAALSAWKEASK
jgi:hypothetical protein